MFNIEQYLLHKCDISPNAKLVKLDDILQSKKQSHTKEVQNFNTKKTRHEVIENVKHLNKNIVVIDYKENKVPCNEGYCLENKDSAISSHTDNGNTNLSEIVTRQSYNKYKNNCIREKYSLENSKCDLISNGNNTRSQRHTKRRKKKSAGNAADNRKIKSDSVNVKTDERLILERNITCPLQETGSSLLNKNCVEKLYKKDSTDWKISQCTTKTLKYMRKRKEMMDCAIVQTGEDEYLMDNKNLGNISQLLEDWGSDDESVITFKTPTIKSKPNINITPRMQLLQQWTQTNNRILSPNVSSILQKKNSSMQKDCALHVYYHHIRKKKRKLAPKNLEVDQLYSNTTELLKLPELANNTSLSSMDDYFQDSY